MISAPTRRHPPRRRENEGVGRFLIHLDDHLRDLGGAGRLAGCLLEPGNLLDAAGEFRLSDLYRVRCETIIFIGDEDFAREIGIVEKGQDVLAGVLAGDLLDRGVDDR